jgi:hypothetical protein
MNTPSPAATDSLSLILDDMHFEGVRFAFSVNQSPWAWQLATPGVACTHQVVQGEAWLVREDAEPLHLVAGDLVVLPAGTAHRIQDHPRSLAKPRDMLSLMSDSAPTAPASASMGDQATACQLISTHARFDVNLAAPLIRALPPLLHVRGHGASPPPWLDVGMQFLAIQVAMPSPGQQAILNRIGDILFMQVIRDHVASVPEGSGNWLAALKDKALSAALAHIHQDPRRNWTVPELAQQACLSRSAFAERFTQTMGEPPLTYLTRQPHAAGCAPVEPHRHAGEPGGGPGGLRLRGGLQPGLQARVRGLAHGVAAAAAGRGGDRSGKQLGARQRRCAGSRGLNPAGRQGPRAWHVIEHTMTKARTNRASLWMRPWGQQAQRRGEPDVPEPPSKEATLRLGLMKRDRPPPEPEPLPASATALASILSHAAGASPACGS